MSETKITKGRLEIVSKDYNKELLNVFIGENDVLYIDNIDSDFIPIRNKVHSDIEFIYNKGTLYQVVDFYSEDFYDDLVETSQDEDKLGVDFIYIYYNGGTCFEEIIEKELNKLD